MPDAQREIAKPRAETPTAFLRVLATELSHNRRVCEVGLLRGGRTTYEDFESDLAITLATALRRSSASPASVCDVRTFTL